MRPIIAAAIAALLAACSSAPQAAPTPPHAEPAPGTVAYDRDVWTDLLDTHDAIHRSVKHIDGGVEAVTESDDPAVAAKIKDHAFAMQRRMKEGLRVRQWDPLFVALFDRHDAITLVVVETEKGVSIRETSSDPEVVALLQAHAAGVDAMVREGFSASRVETPMPPRQAAPANGG